MLVNSTPKAIKHHTPAPGFHWPAGVPSRGWEGLFRIVRDRDVAPEAYRDVFTAVLKRPSRLLLGPAVVPLRADAG
jgi:hypothetical protein